MLVYIYPWHPMRFVSLVGLPLTPPFLSIRDAVHIAKRENMHALKPAHL